MTTMRAEWTHLFTKIRQVVDEGRPLECLDSGTQQQLEKLLHDEHAGYTLIQCMYQMCKTGGTCATCTGTCGENMRIKTGNANGSCTHVHAWRPGRKWGTLSEEQKLARMYWRQLLGYDKRTVYTVNKLGNFPRRKEVNT